MIIHISAFIFPLLFKSFVKTIAQCKTQELDGTYSIDNWCDVMLPLEQFERGSAPRNKWRNYKNKTIKYNRKLWNHSSINCLNKRNMWPSHARRFKRMARHVACFINVPHDNIRHDCPMVLNVYYLNFI